MPRIVTPLQGYVFASREIIIKNYTEASKQKALAGFTDKGFCIAVRRRIVCWLVYFYQLYFEDECGKGRNLSAGTALAVGQVGRDV